MGRNILISLGLMVVVMASSLGVCRVLGCEAHVGDMGLAAAVCLVAAILGLMPISFVGGGSLVRLFQAAFAGSVLHMMVAAALSVVAVFVLRRGNVFVYWMLALYWLTLLELLVIFVGKSRGFERPAGASV